MDPAVCLGLTEHIHGKKFFNRKVYVTSVVERTPTKETAEPVDDCPALAESSEPESSESEAEDSVTATKSPCSKPFTNISAPGKIPPSGSPEVSSEKQKKDKKKKKENISGSTAVRSSSRQGKSSNK